METIDAYTVAPSIKRKEYWSVFDIEGHEAFGPYFSTEWAEGYRVRLNIAFNAGVQYTLKNIDALSKVATDKQFKGQGV